MVGELFGRILVSALALLVDDAGFNSCDPPPNQTRSLCFFWEDDGSIEPCCRR